MSNEYIIYNFCAEMQGTRSRREATVNNFSLTRSSAVAQRPLVSLKILPSLSHSNLHLFVLHCNIALYRLRGKARDLSRKPRFFDTVLLHNNLLGNVFALFSKPNQITSLSDGVNRFCNKSSVYSQLKCAIDGQRQTERQTEKRSQ